ncbi:MAG: Holliday junction branch migration protein RuvA [Dehalococcoidales bacterium]|nr:Holliday junction branch migration protein RuvA [Dehalococcoidales bacterium]
MIASLQGTVDAIGGDFLIVNVNGVGFKVTVNTSVLSEGGVIGRGIKLFTHLHVREDDLSLYGFASPDGLRLFDLLLTVSGLGPKTAMNMLSGMSADELTMAIASGSTEMLTSIPGIGKKTADRLILELRDKVGGVMISTASGRAAQENADVVSALVSLGYTVSEASRAVAALPAGKKLALEEKVKLALQSLGG